MKIDRKLPRWTYLLFIPPYISVFWVTPYNTLMPDFMGIPFFYWYQLLWVVLSALAIAVAYFNLREEPVDDTDGAQ